MIVKVYESKIDNSTTVVCNLPDEPLVLKYQKLLLESDAVLIRTIEGEDWNDCMRQHYKLMGWKDYVPFDEE
jgi:hypothetical protein